MAPRTARLWAFLALSLALVLGGGSLASYVQTSGGEVEVRETAFFSPTGERISGLLYVPRKASVDDPAPGVLAVHGYLNSRELQVGPIVELSRRGHVVLAIDQYGHGRSDGQALAGDFGGPAALEFLRSLEFVDEDNIGLTGHSLGGATVLNAALADPDGYKSMVLQASSTAVFTPEGLTDIASPDFPRNVKVIIPAFEESYGVWGAETVPQIEEESPTVRALTGIDSPMAVGELYGSIDDGTARKITRPLTNHPGATHDIGAVQDIVDWFDQTLDGGTHSIGAPWWVKEIGTLTSLVGAVMLVLATASLLLQTPYFGSARQTVPQASGLRRGLPWLVGALLTAGIPAATYMLFTAWGTSWIPANSIFAQPYTTAIAVWAVLNGIIGLAIYLVGRRFTKAQADATASNTGLAVASGFRWTTVGRSALLAVLSVSAAYLSLAINGFLFKADFRAYLLQFQLMDVTRFGQFLVYLLPFAVFFVLLGITLHNTQRWTGRPTSRRTEMITNAIVLPMGIVVLIALQYIPFIVTGSIPFDDHRIIIISFAVVPVLVIAALISTYLFHETGLIYAGAFIAALLVSWNLAGGMPNEAPVGEWEGVAVATRVALPLIVTAGLLILAWRNWRRSRALQEVTS